MKQYGSPFNLLPAILATLTALVPAVKFTPDANMSLLEMGSNQSNKTDVQLALLARSSRASVDEEELEMDTSLSAKGNPIAAVGDFFGDVVDTAGDALGGVVDHVGNAVQTAAEAAADTLHKAGMTVGSAVANAAVIVGKHVVQPAITTIASLPGHIQNVANDIGRVAVNVGNVIADVGELVADSTVQLAGDVLTRAQAAVNQGVKLAQSVGDEIARQATAIGNGVAKIGPLVAGLGAAAWNQIKSFVSCLAESLTLCHILIGDHCDCGPGKSHVTPSTSGLEMRCVFTTSSDFTGGFGLRASASKTFDGSSGTTVLPGEEYMQAYKMANTALKSRETLKSKKAKAPRGSCETELEVAWEGAAQFTPDISVSMGFNGDTEISISGLVRASIDALVEGQGSCSFHAQRGLPKVPKTKVVCAGKFCLVFMLQFVAELEIKGTLTGTIETSAAVDFEIKGKVVVNPKGKAESHFETPSIKHQDGFAIGASASTSVRLGMGPVFTVWPVPGIPINFNAMINAEAKALGTLEFRSGMLLLQEDEESRKLDVNKQLHDVNDFMNATSNTIGLCGAAVLTTFADIDITGFALPSGFRAVLNTDMIVDKISEAIMKGATALLQLITGPLKCIPGGETVSNTINSAANTASATLTSLIPSLHLDFNVKSIELLKPQKLWCKEVYKTPGFDQAPCAATLGCKFAGRPPPRDVEMPPPEQVTNTMSAAASAPSSCPTVEGSLKMGDRFIQVGSFRLGAHDDHHFSVQHESGWTAQIYKSDGTTHCANHRPRRDYGTWHRDVTPSGTSRGISFGFQYIQFGKFRLGAIDDTHLSLSHENGNTIIIFRSDRQRFGGPRSDWGAWDRSEGAPFGVSFGDRYIQIGKFRLGCNDYNHFAVTHTSGQLLQLYRNDGTEHPAAGNQWTVSVNRRQPAPWTCKDIAEVAYGACDSDWGGFGDRFIQLGNFRLAAIDATHFSVCHRDGWVSMIYRADGTRHGGPRRDFCSWDRPLGFPHGITFGPGFIQLGNFRLGAIDDEHLSIAHESGKTAQIFRSDDTRHPGPRTDWTAWGQSAGPAAGVTFGDRFLQLGNFRVGDHDGRHLVVAHKGGAAIQLFHADGSRHPLVGSHWSTNIRGRYPQWHCGGIQDVMGTCPGLAAGDNLLMIGDWRLAANDANHFTISHRAGQTPIIYVSINKHYPGPQTGWNSWGLEIKDAHHKLQFGDRFIQFGSWRLGEWDSQHLTLSHSNGNTPMIWRTDGTRHPNRRSHGLWHRPLGAAEGITFGDRFVQIGGFRVGDVDSRHFSVTNVNGVTIQILREDGHTFNGPRHDFTTFGRQLSDCAVV
ncbi:unnamed protein product [Symbiodinium sp. CCMP2592]|nr:unnamed protein product [Symbiodinium sp. CCMP2592]